MSEQRARIIFGGIVACFILVWVRAAEIMLLKQIGGHYFLWVFPLTTAAVFVGVMLYSETVNLKEYLKGIANKEGHAVISLVYGNFLGRKYKKISVWLAILTCVMLLLSIFVDIFNENLSICLFPAWLIVLLLFRNKLISLRIEAGVFGSTASEAKELIKFMIANSENVDFTDTDGKIKKSFLPESLLVENPGVTELEGILHP